MGASALKNVLSVSGALLIVIGAILVVYWAARYLQSQGAAGNGRALKILDRVVLGKDKYLMLVEFQENTYFIGVTDHNINLLEKVEGKLDLTVMPTSFKTHLTMVTKEGFLTAQKGSHNEHERDE